MARKEKQRFEDVFQKYGLIVAFAILCVVLSLLSPHFLTGPNILIVLRQISINAILAIGVTFVILTGGIDLSLAIRTAVHRDSALHLHLGGGIVADSEPRAELAETCDKGDAFAWLWRPHSTA